MALTKVQHGLLEATGTASSSTFLRGDGAWAAPAADGVGYNQTWQNVAGSRAKRTTYQNTTGKPIVVAVSFVSPFTSVLQLWTHSASANILVDGVMIMQADGGDYYSSSQYTNHPANVSAIIVPNYFYQLYDPNNDVTIQFWTELR
jgi:hypothetical protein